MRGEVLRPDGEDAHRGGYAVLRRTGGPPATPAALTRASQVPKYERQTTIVSTSSIHEFSRVLGKSVMYLIPLKLCAGLVHYVRGIRPGHRGELRPQDRHLVLRRGGVHGPQAAFSPLGAASWGTFISDVGCNVPGLLSKCALVRFQTVLASYQMYNDRSHRQCVNRPGLNCI